LAVGVRIAYFYPVGGARRGRYDVPEGIMTFRWIYLRICLALICAGTPGFGPVAATAQTGPAAEGAVDGIWRSRGYGWLWRITGDRIEPFDIGEGFCIPASSAAEDTGRAYRSAELADEGRTLRLRLQDPDYVYTFDRQSALPAACLHTAPATAGSVFDAAVRMFDEHYAFFEVRGIDWPVTVAAARSALRPDMDDADLIAVLETLIAPFEDSHVYVEAEFDGEDAEIYGSEDRPETATDGKPAIGATWNARAAVASLDPVRRRGDDTLIYGRFPEGIGYLRVDSMSGMKAARLETALDDAMASFDGAEAVIVDVSENGGGFDSFARLIARRFAAAPTVGYTKNAGDFAGAAPQEIVLQPPDRPRFLGPVYLITGHETASAAEVFALAMRALPNVVHLGEATDGSLSDELWKTLPNGWTLSLSNEVYLDSDGVLWEGRGIQPEIVLPVANNRRVSREDRRSVRTVLEFVKTGR
jgi:carboxyl-terminal processing protease